MPYRLIREVQVRGIVDRTVTPSRTPSATADVGLARDAYTVRVATFEDGSEGVAGRLEPLLGSGSRVSVAIDAQRQICAVINHTTGASGSARGTGATRLGELFSTAMFAVPIAGFGAWLCVRALSGGGVVGDPSALVPFGFGACAVALGVYLLVASVRGDAAALAALRER